MKNGMKRKENAYYQLPIDQDVVPENVTPSIPHEHMKIGDSIFLHPDQLKISMNRIVALIRSWAYSGEKGPEKEVIKYWGYRRENGGLRVWRLPTSDYHLPIERDVPIPDDHTIIGQVAAIPHKDMQEGESVFIPIGWKGFNADKLRRLSNKLTLKHKRKRKFTGRKDVDVDGREGYRIWRVSLEDPDEVLEIDPDIPPPGEE